MAMVSWLQGKDGRWEGLAQDKSCFLHDSKNQQGGGESQGQNGPFRSHPRDYLQPGSTSHSAFSHELISEGSAER